MKYQFCIRFENTTINSAATKAIADCNKIFLENGYKDYTFTVWDNSKKLIYYLLLLKEIIFFFAHLEKGAVVGIQYPLLSINNFFKYFIKAARLKGIKFFCIVHDLESLRTGGKNNVSINREITNLNYFDCIIGHNNKMINWLKQNGFRSKSVSLGVFDYLSDSMIEDHNISFDTSIVYAGNLSKSTFIYHLPEIKEWQFNVYGPYFNKEKLLENVNVNWQGEFNTEQIVKELTGRFGLIWDGSSIEKCDEVLGNYLKYNNPHKFSLYVAAGLPVIAPKESAIGDFIVENNIGILVNSLIELSNMSISDSEYRVMKNNIAALRKDVVTGNYFKRAVIKAEKNICE